MTLIKQIKTMSDAPHAELMHSLAGKHHVLAGLIGTAPVHYVDLPVHRNIGDLLIMLGTLRFFALHELKINLKAAYFTYRPSWARAGDVIVFQGGGNLGDLYAGPQQMRQHVVEKLPGNRIIIFPQTIHFRSADAYAQCCRIFSKHPDLHICVRDHKSFELAVPMSRHVYLLPDMAHQLWPIQQARCFEGRRLALLRADVESAGCEVIDFDVRIDWRELVRRKNTLIRMMRGVLAALHLAHVDSGILSLEMNLWIKYATKLVGEAIDLFSRFEVITTDRLHAHILSCLMGIPNTVLNNSYGKNYSYITAWTGSSNIVDLPSENHRMKPRNIV
jgi:pyruvyl transferase EpsO